MKYVFYMSLFFIILMFSFATLQGYGWCIVTPAFIYTIKLLRED